jgi:AcrR family transcriptional regulator
MATKTSPERARPSARSALLRAAVAEFASKGYESATVAGIAARAGVTTGALYTHFRNKQELLLEAVGLHTVEILTQRAAGLAGRPPDEVARGLARGLVGEAPGRRDLLWMDAIAIARRDPKVADAYRRVIRAQLEAFDVTTQRAVDSGRIDPILPHGELARLVLSLALGVMALRALDETPPSESTIARLTEQLLRPARERGKPGERALARVQSHARSAARAQADLHAQIVQAAGEGHSLRKIGDAAGLSHERIRRILSEHPSENVTATEI